jgi:GxxExxY protein
MREITTDRGIPSHPIETLTSRIISCFIQVHRTLGCGFLESVYRRALVVELEKHSLSTEVEREVPAYYDGQEVGRHRLDLLVEGQIILELKTVESLNGSLRAGAVLSQGDGNSSCIADQLL